MTFLQCNRTTAINSFFLEMIPSPIKVGWVGSGCAVATEPTAELTQFYNITQVLIYCHVYFLIYNAYQVYQTIS